MPGIISAMLRIFSTILITLFFVNAHAQEWEFGIQGGASGYMGDLNPENPFAFNDWSAGASVKYNLNHTWGIRGNFAYANTYARDIHSPHPQRRERNLSFYGAIKEAALLVDFNFFKWLPQRGRIVYTPYIFAGIGGIQFDPMWYHPDTPGTPIHLRDYQTEDSLYNNTTVTIPFGAGFKYNLRGSWSIGIELGYRLAFTDYLDDVHGNYVNFDDFGDDIPKIGNDPIDASHWQEFSNPGGFPVGTQRGDGRRFDSFMTIGITLSYTIFKGGCPEWQ